MTKPQSSRERELLLEVEHLKDRLSELEATQQAIRGGEVDAIIVEGPNGNQIFTLQSPDDPYRILAERMNEGAATLSPDGIVLFCNSRLSELVCRSPEHLLGSSFFALIRESQREAFQELLQQGFKKDVRAEFELQREEGSLVPVQLSLSLARLNDTDATFCVVATDLTELKVAKRGLLEQAQVFELAHDAIFIRELYSRIQTWNRGATDLYGWTADEALGRVSSELLHTVYPEPLEGILSALQESKEWDGELQQTRRDGKVITVESRWSLLRDDRGNPTSILEINRDITARKEAEHKLNAASRYVRNLIEASLDPLVTISREGKITDVNEATEKVTGLPRRRLIGTDFSAYFTEPEKARRGYEQAFAEGAVRDYPLTIRSTAGVITHVLYNASVFRNQAGEVEGLFAAARDVTERMRAEAERVSANEALRKLNQELESRVERRTAEISSINAQLAESMANLESFAYSVSHDLRAPLRHLDGFLSLLFDRSYSCLDDTARHYMDRMQEASQRMGRLIDELLQFSKLGREELHKAEVDLNRLVREALRELEPATQDRDIVWTIDSLPHVAADQPMLRQLLENLLANAIKFTRGRSPAEIHVGSRLGQDGEVTVFVRDNGVGFDMRYYGKMFQIFQRLHSENDFEGTGIGLALAKRVVERHGGRIWAEAALGKGATFYVSLPANLCQGEDHELAQTHLVG